jgi:1,4-dihydroxy-2-naphthoate octaprenyltransferase
MPWIQAFRPKTLTAAVVPVLVGSAVAFREIGPIHQRITLLALLGALFIQIATNLFNDAIDFKKGADRETRIGPQRATQMGWLTGAQVMRMAFIFLLLAVACGVPLVLRGGEVIVAIGLVSVLMAYAYTGGPFPLAYLGLGDLFVILFFGLVAVGGTYYLHVLQFSWGALVAGLQVGCLSTVLIAINNFRDREEDEKVGKNTLAVRFGAGFVRYEILFLYLVSFSLGGYWWTQGNKWAAILPLVALPLALRVVKGVFFNPPSPLFNRFLALASLVQILFGILFVFGLITAWPRL